MVIHVLNKKNKYFQILCNTISKAIPTKLKYNTADFMYTQHSVSIHIIKTKGYFQIYIF